MPQTVDIKDLQTQYNVAGRPVSEQKYNDMLSLLRYTQAGGLPIKTAKNTLFQMLMDTSVEDDAQEQELANLDLGAAWYESDDPLLKQAGLSLLQKHGNRLGVDFNGAGIGAQYNFNPEQYAQIRRSNRINELEGTLAAPPEGENIEQVSAELNALINNQLDPYNKFYRYNPEAKSYGYYDVINPFNSISKRQLYYNDPVVRDYIKKDRFKANPLGYSFKNTYLPVDAQGNPTI